MDLDYLKLQVRGSIITNIIQVAINHSKQGGTNAGWYSVPREVFCMVDFLGSISYNNDPKKREDGASTRKAVRFIKEFFPKHYKPYANLLVAIWRHGTVHNFLPTVFFVMHGNQKIILKWTSNRSNAQHNRIVNMKTFDKKDSKDTIYLSINICQLADDLLGAFDKFIQKIETNSSFQNGCLRRVKRSFSMKNCMTLARTGKQEKNELRKQIFLAKNSTKGKIDKDLQVTWNPIK